jgi:hypothetical protein
MAIAFRAATLDAGATITTRTISAPAGRVAGDVLLLAVMPESKTVTIAVAGYTSAIPQLGETTEVWKACLFWRVATGTSADDAVITWGGSSIFIQGIMAAYSGTDATTPINVASSAFKDNNAASTNAPVDAITTTSDQCLPVTFVYNDQGGVTTAATGWTEDADQASGPEAAHKNATISPAGTTGAVTHTLSGSFRSLTGMVALQPPQARKSLVSDLRRTVRNTLLRR